MRWGFSRDRITIEVLRLLESFEAVAGLPETDLQELEDVGLVVEGGDHWGHGSTSRPSYTFIIINFLFLTQFLSILNNAVLEWACSEET